MPKASGCRLDEGACLLGEGARALSAAPQAADGRRGRPGTLCDSRANLPEREESDPPAAGRGRSR